MLGLASLYTSAPLLPVVEPHLRLHELYDFLLTQAKLGLNGLKWRAIFPGHVDDPIYIAVAELIFDDELADV